MEGIRRTVGESVQVMYAEGCRITEGMQGWQAWWKTVINIGTRRGAEVAQLYVCDQISSVTRPVKELKGFRRMTLAPGEAQTIEFEITPDQLSFLDAQWERRVEPGTFVLMIGSSSEQTQTVLLEVAA